MKYFFVSILIVAMVACSAAPSPVKEEAVLVLSKDKFVVDGITTNFAGAMTYLAPPDSTQIELTFCPNNSMGVASHIITALKVAGYNRIGFAPLRDSDSKLCANISFKADASGAA